MTKEEKIQLNKDNENDGEMLRAVRSALHVYYSPESVPERIDDEMEKLFDEIMADKYPETFGQLINKE